MNKNIFYSERQDKKKIQYTQRTQPPIQNKPAQGFEPIPRIFEVMSVQTYKKIQKPNLNPQKLNRIAKKLDLEEQAKVNFNVRKNANELVIKYDVNPFSKVYQQKGRQIQQKQSKMHQKSKQQIESYHQLQFHQNSSQNSKNNSFKLINLIEGVQKFRKRNVNEVNLARDMDFSISDRSKETQNFVNIIKEMTLKQPFHRTVQSSSSSSEVMPKPLEIKKRSYENQEHFKSVMQFSNIVNLKQKSYYLTNQKIDNIFDLVFHRDENITMGNDILDKYHLSHDSMKETTKNVKIPTYRDISRLSRNLIRGIYNKESKKQFLSLSELNVAMNNITIESILSIAAGRSTPDDINEQMRDQHLASASLSKEDQTSLSSTVEKEIRYNDNTICYGTQKNDESDYLNQSKEFLSIPFNSKEQKYIAEMQQILKQFNILQIQKQQIKSQHIKDKIMMESIQKKEQKQLNAMFLKDANLQKGNVDRTIRRNKKFKDRGEEISIKSMITASITKKNYDNKLNTQSHLPKPTNQIVKNIRQK